MRLNLVESNVIALALLCSLFEGLQEVNSLSNQLLVAYSEFAVLKLIEMLSYELSIRAL